jgi:mycothiol synthase
VATVSTDVPDETVRQAVLRLADEIERADGAPPLSDQTLTLLGSPDVAHFVATQDGTVVGYAQRDGDSAEVAARPDVLRLLIDRLAEPGVLVWAHGRHSRLRQPLRDLGFEPVRELYQVRRPLTDLPDDPPLPEGVKIRAFEPGADDAAWLVVNAAAFAAHAEQGRWTQRDLAARLAEPWFDPAGFLLAVRDGELLGYHWTKIHPDGLGEVYVLGIAPSAQKLGLGRALLVRGLRYLAERGCPEVLLYVDGDNASARHLYERFGFTDYDVDVQWQLPDVGRQ